MKIICDLFGCEYDWMNLYLLVFISVFLIGLVIWCEICLVVVLGYSVCIIIVLKVNGGFLD